MIFSVRRPNRFCVRDLRDAVPPGQLVNRKASVRVSTNSPASSAPSGKDARGRLLNRQLETLNSLAAAQTEGQLVANKVQRDVLADAINFNGQVDSATANQATVWGGSAATIQSW